MEKNVNWIFCVALNNIIWTPLNSKYPPFPSLLISNSVAFIECGH